jgi:hypothetical protein
MKKVKLALISILFIFSSLSIFAQGNPPPPPDEHGSGDDQGPGGSAPIGSGLVILTILGSAYVAGRTYSLQRRKDN